MVKTTKKKNVAKANKKRYKYVVFVRETVDSKATICSDRKLAWRELEQMAERRRISGKLSLHGVSDVEMWCEAAYVNGRQMNKRALA